MPFDAQGANERLSMKKLIVIKAGRTEWVDQNRIAGDADLSLNNAGRAEVFAIVNELTPLAPKSAFCGTDTPSMETARIVCEALQLKPKSLDELRELDLGHWEGLTIEQFSERFPKVYKAWRDNPAAVEPPDGEPIAVVEARLDSAILRVMKRKTASPILLVLGRLAYAIARCRYTNASPDEFWHFTEGDERVFSFDISPDGPTPMPAAPS